MIRRRHRRCSPVKNRQSRFLEEYCDVAATQIRNSKIRNSIAIEVADCHADRKLSRWKRATWTLRKSARPGSQ